MTTFNELAKRAPGLLNWGRCVELISAPGMGKSTFVHDLTRRMSTPENPWGFATAFLATYSPIDLPGFMIPTKTDAGYIADYTRPAWMRTIDGKTVFDYENGILLLDEFGQADVDVKKAAADLMLHKRIGRWVLPAGWRVWAASNRTSDRSGVTKSLDFVINRRMEIHISGDVVSLENWMIDNGVHPLIVSFMVNHPTVVMADSVPKEQGPYMTPRSLVMAGEYLRAAATDQERLTVDGTAAEMVGGLVGHGATLQLMSHLKLYDVLPTYHEVVADPGAAKLPKENPAAHMTICYALAQKVEAAHMEQAIHYVRRLPSEFALVFVKSAVRRDTNLLNTKPLGDWLRGNPSLVAAVSAASAKT